MQDISSPIPAVSPPAASQQVATILDSIGELFIACDRDWRLTFINAKADKYLKAIGRTREELLGQVVWDVVPGLAGSRFHKAALRAAADQVSVEVEDCYRPAKRWFAARISPSADGVVSYSRDITERKRAQAAARASEQRFRALVESVEDVLYELDRDRRIVRIFGRWLERQGLRASELVGQTLADLLGEGTASVHEDAARRALAGESVVYDWSLPTLGGRRYMQMSLSPLRGPGGAITGAVGVGREVTDRIRVEQRQRFLAEASAVLSASLDPEATLDSVARLAVGGLADLCMVDLVAGDGSIRRVAAAHRDPAMHELVGRFRRFAPQSASDSPPATVIRTGRPMILPEITDQIQRAAATDDEHLRVLRLLALRSGMVVPLVARGRTLGAISLLATVTPRTYTPDDLALAEDLAFRAALAVDNARLYSAAQAELRQRREAEAELRRWARIFEHAGWGVLIGSADGRTLEAMNPAFAQMHQYTIAELVGQPMERVVTPDAQGALAEHLRIARATGRHAYESWHVRRDGSVFPVLVDIAPVRDDSGAVQHYAINVRDITAQRRADDQLRQAQKMEAVGRLAGGVAHDFNNMLMIIIGFSDLLLAALERGDLRRADAEEIRKAAERAAALTQQLLAFGRHQLLQSDSLDLNEVLRDMERMLRPLVGEHIHFSANLSSVLGRIQGDRGQLEQVIMNLVLNARDAMPAGGQLTIETMNVTFPAGYAYRTVGIDMPEGRYVMVVVSDTGHGMDPETRSRIFEPFFTTKESSQNSGLGLATVYAIVTQSGGYLWVDSEPGQGTTFKLCFPRVGGEEPAAELPERVAPRGGNETILVVEDEEAVRSLTARVLQEQGYTVLQARDGREALELLAAGDTLPQLVLTDVVMPVMGGRELAECLEQRYPSVRILYMSGYTDREVLRQNLEANGRLLPKPFSPESLAYRVREMLDAAALAPVQE